jgi:glucokinase
MRDGVIGIDIGGTNIRVGLVNERFELVRKETVWTSRFLNADEMLHQIRTMIENVDYDKKADRIGMALPVPWTNQTESIVDATFIPCLEKTSVHKIKSYFSDYEVYIENDVNVISLLESALGASQGYEHSMYITVSTGIGSGIILNHEVFRGAHGYAGEIGGMIFSGQTLESLCCGMALETESKRLYGHDATTELLFSKYDQKDPQAKRVLTAWIEHFSNAIATLMQTIDPEIFVIGGSVIHYNPWLIDEVIHNARNKVLENLKDKIKIVMPKFGPDAGMIGAGYMALNQPKGESYKWQK